MDHFGGNSETKIAKEENNQAHTKKAHVCPTDAGLAVLWNQRLSLREGSSDSAETDDDRSALPLMCTYQPIGELCHCRDLCLNPSPLPPSMCYDFHHLQHSVFQHLLGVGHAALWPPLSLAATQSVFFARGTLDLSLGRIWERHLFSFTQLSLSRRKIILYIYELPCLRGYTELLF